MFAAACGSGTSESTSSRAVTPASTPATVGAAQSATSATTGATTVLPQLPVTVPDKDGKRITITDVSRIVSLNGDITEVIFALGLGKNVVGTDVSATYPEEAKALPRVDNRRQIGAESVLSLRPTLVIGNDNAGPPAAIEQLRGAGVPVLIITYPTTVDSVTQKIRTVAGALGVPEQGEALATRTQSEINAARTLAAKAETKPRVAFLYIRGGTPTQQIAGKNTAADAVISAAGALNTGAQAGIEGYQPITAESIVTAAPDVFLLLDASLESIGGVDGLVKLPGVAQTPAGQKRAVLHYDDQYLLGMGPRIGQALMDLVRGLHPTLR